MWFSIFVLLLRIAFYVCLQLTEINGKKIADIYWNTSNPIFHYDDSAHLFIVRIRDSVDIICPKYNIGYPEHLIEYSLIYMVDRPNYESCAIDSKSARIVGICTRPYLDQIITVVFREFTPNPNLLEFVSGRDYYFISTSDGSKSGLMNEQNGLCRYFNMRLSFFIEPRQYSPVIDEKLTKHSESHEDQNDNSRTNIESQDQIFRGPPPIMILPRTPTSFGGRPFYGDKSSYPSGQWWNGRSYNDAFNEFSHRISYNGATQIDSLSRFILRSIFSIAYFLIIRLFFYWRLSS